MYFPTFEELTIQNDFLFKKVMQHKRICKHLLEELLQIKIADITYIETEKEVKPLYNSKGIRLDVLVADENNTHYNLEMQVRNTIDRNTGEALLPLRTRYYLDTMDMDSLKAGDAYTKLPQTYIIFICVFDLFGDDRYLYTFDNRCRQNTDIALNDKVTKVFLNTLGSKDEISPDLKSFCDYVNKNIITSDFTAEIDNEITSLKQDEEVRAGFMSYRYMYQEALIEGEALGEARGEAKGKTDEKFATARRMLAAGGLSAEFISQMTALSLAEVKKLQAETAVN